MPHLIAALASAPAILLSTPALVGSDGDLSAPRCFGKTATIVGDNRSEILHGTRHADVIVALGGNDSIYGLGGNDRVCAGRGLDWVYGSRGDDRLADEVTPDVVSWTSATRGVRVDVAAGRATGQGHDRFDARGVAVVGSRYADVMLGSAADDRLYGSYGDDRLVGRAGDDVLTSDEASVKRGGADVVLGGRGQDSITSAGGDGTDALELFSNRINPLGEPASATLDLATGRLRYAGPSGESRASVDGIERLGLNTWTTAWTIDGTSANDEVLGSGSAGTTFRGHAGDDIFSGSASDDVFDGGPGADRARVMGVGDDTCVSVEQIDQADCEQVS